MKQFWFSIFNPSLILTSLTAKSAGQVCRSSLPAMSAGQVCRPSQLAKSAGQVYRPSLPAKSAGQVCRPSLPVKSPQNAPHIDCVHFSEIFFSRNFSKKKISREIREQEKEIEILLYFWYFDY
jgi:hypothetical protein